MIIMDFIFHLLWSFIIFHKADFFVSMLAVFFGALPDFVAFVPLFFEMMLFGRKIDFKKRDEKQVPKYVFKLYNISHSIVIFIILFIPAYMLFGPIALVMITWFIHILVDIPTHSRAFFGTRFLYPLSDYSFDGYTWSNWKSLAVNYSLIMIFFILILMGIF